MTYYPKNKIKTNLTATSVDDLIIANSNNSYYITFYYLEQSNGVANNEIDINYIVNYIRLTYKLNNIPYVVEYDNIEYEIIKSVSTLTTTLETTTTTTLLTYKLLLKS